MEKDFTEKDFIKKGFIEKDSIEKDYILKIEGISKSFPGVKALDQVSFGVERGTIHALVGENGAGKSTLIKVLSGIYHAESGEILLDGKRCNFTQPSDARAAGISVVHQEIKLAEPLSVAENMFLGNLPVKNGLVNWKEMRVKAQNIIDELGIDIDVNQAVNTLTIAKKQIVEIMHAINFGSKIMIMDEPSATLTEHELKVLFRIVKKLRDKGITIIYISHRLEEVFELTTTTTVLRDGCHIATLPTASLTKEQLISLMVGRELGNEFPKECYPIGETILEVRNLTRKKVLRDISFSVNKGEVFGISGLVGAGRTELVRAILGIDPYDSGKIFYKNKEVSFKSFHEAIRNGFGLIPEDRKLQGLVQMMDVKTNICLANLDKVLHGGIIRSALEKKYAEEYVKKLSISTPSIHTEVQYLSGGNQQKVVIAKWLLRDSEILILDEPTRGIDVGAKTEIYRLINRMVKAGKTIIIISSEMPEIIGMCDRVMIMHEGRKTGELMRSDATQERIMAACV